MTALKDACFLYKQNVEKRQIQFSNKIRHGNKAIYMREKNILNASPRIVKSKNSINPKINRI